MIHALRFEDPEQRFAPQERQRAGEQGRHIHFHMHLHLRLSFRAHQRHSSHPTAIRVTRIYAALVAATCIVFMIYLMVVPCIPSTPHLFTIAGIGALVGLLLAWLTVFLGGLPLLVSAWRSTPRVRFLLAVPLFGPLLYWLILIRLFDWIPLWPVLTAFLLLYGFILICTISLNRAVRRAAIADTWLRFANRLSFFVVGGMVLLLIGTFFWGISFVLNAPGWLQMGWPWYVKLAFPLGMCIAVIVAVYTLFSRPRSSNNAQPRPQDDSPFDFISSRTNEE